MKKQEIDGEINALKNLLSQTDYQALKFSEGELSEDEYAPIKEKRQQYRDRINELESVEPEEEDHIQAKNIWTSTLTRQITPQRAHFYTIMWHNFWTKHYNF